MALCRIRQKKFEEAVLVAGRAVQADPGYAKGLYRRATALTKLGRRVEAGFDFKRILELEPMNQQVQGELDKLMARLTPEEREKVQGFGEGFKRVEIEEGEDSDSESDSAEETHPNQEVPPKKEVNPKKNRELQPFVEMLQKKKGEISSQVKKGLFERVMPEMVELIQEAEERRAEVYNLGGGRAGEQLGRVRDMHRVKVPAPDLDQWMRVERLALPDPKTHPHLHSLLELELSLKSNLCYSFKQISQDNQLVFLASSLLALCASLMGEGSLGQVAGRIFQKTLVRRGLGLEQNGRVREGFRDFWVARTFNAQDRVTLDGLSRSRKALGPELVLETRAIEKDFEEYLQTWRKPPGSVKSEAEFSPVGDSPVKTPRDRELKTTLPEKEVQETKPQVEPPESKPEPSIIRRNLSESELDELESCKVQGNALFKKRDIKGAVQKFGECIEQFLKSPMSEFLEPHQQLTGDRPADLTRNQSAPPRTPEKTLRLTSRRSVELLLSVLGNRGMGLQKLGQFGRAFQDASLGIRVFESHREELGPFKFSWGKLHYRRMSSLDGLLTASGEQVRGCRNEFLQIGMLENMLVYLVELAASCRVVRDTEGGTPSEQKAREAEARHSWMRESHSRLQEKRQRNEELSQKIRKSKRELSESSAEVLSCNSLESPPESFDQIARKAMETLLESNTLAGSASEFETHVDSFKENHAMVCRYLLKYSPEKLGLLYQRRELETSFVLKIVCAFETLGDSKDLAEGGRLLKTIMDLPRSRLTFRMMTRKEKARLLSLLEKVNRVQPVVDVEEYRAKFKLPSN